MSVLVILPGCGAPRVFPLGPEMVLYLHFLTALELRFSLGAIACIVLLFDPPLYLRYRPGVTHLDNREILHPSAVLCG